ncbi:MAG TPA: DUF2461 domain-containing protein [Streptosporangiaceae bacterium]|nr:DUF2461 domain-containing protein [Streptosporangiaceae bacterium]
MSFNGWPEAALDFYEGLESDNSKSYWTAHRAIYDTAVLGPMAELTDELGAEFGAVKIFRPNRDIRFSKDKSPYKTAIGAMVGSGYIQLSASGLAAGNGMYVMAPDQLDRFRQAVAADKTGRQLERVVEAINSRDIAVQGHDVLKTAPRGYPADHPRIEILRYKGLVAWKEWPVEPWLSSPAARDHVADFLVATRPLAAWLDANVGSSELEAAGRR